jgi:nitrous oxidase accessory protein NosD
VSGGSLAESAESSNQSRQSAGTSTEKAILNTIGVGPVTSDESLRISVRERNESEKPVKEAGNGVRIYNSHPT